MSSGDNWCVAVFKCTQGSIKNVLLDFYNFVRDLEGVKSLHFLIRDRVKNEIFVSFRVLTAEKSKDIVKSKMNYKLNELVPGKFAFDPDSKNILKKHVAWGPSKRLSESGVDKFPEFCNYLSKMSSLVIETLRNNYFSSAERVEIAHVMSWMLGCAEYGILSPTHFEVGYYDRIEDKYSQYLKQDFPQIQKPET